MNKVELDLDFIEDNFYYICFNDQREKIYSILLSDLQKKDELVAFIEYYTKKVKGVNGDVAASYFCSAYGWVLSSFQYVISVLDITYETLLNNIELQMYYNEEHDFYRICFRIIDMNEIFLTGNRDAWAKTTLEQLYSKNVVPLVNHLHEVTNVTKRDLYGQLAIGLYNGYDVTMNFPENKVKKEIVQKDFYFLTKELGNDVFDLPKNPLDIHFKMIESVHEEGVMIRMKPSCCLYYQTDGATTKCYSCPRMSEEERAEHKKEILARQ